MSQLCIVERKCTLVDKKHISARLINAEGKDILIGTTLYRCHLRSHRGLTLY